MFRDSEPKNGFVATAIVVVVAAILLIGASFWLGRSSVGGSERSLPAVVSKTVSDVLGSRDRQPVLVVDLGNKGSVGVSKNNSIQAKSSQGASSSQIDQAIEKTTSGTEKQIVTDAFVEPISCNFSPTIEPNHHVLLNEIAWMGGEKSATDEWIEFKNNLGSDMKLAGWQLVNRDNDFKIGFGPSDVLHSGDFYLLERTDDSSVPNITADKIYSGSLSNSGEWLRLFDSKCDLIDEVNASSSWPGGDNATKQTLERNVKDFGWHTSVAKGGTPRAQNSEPGPVVFENNTQTQASTPSQQSNATSTSSQPSSTAPTTQPGRVLISEVLFDAVGSDAGKEFIELYNPSSVDVDLTDWSIANGSSSLAKIGSKFGEKTKINAGGYFLAGFSSWNQSPVADVVRSASLPNDNGNINLFDASGILRDAMTYSSSTITPGESVERVSWDSNDFKAELSPNPQNSGL